MDNYNAEMDRTSVTNDNDNVNDNVNVDHGNDENHDNNDGNDDNDDMICDYNLVIGDLLPIVSLKRRSAIPEQVLNDGDTAGREATADSIDASVAVVATATATIVRPTQPRSITPNLFLPILVSEDEEDENRDDASADEEEEGKGDWKDTTNNKEEVRTKGEEGNTDEETETQTPTPVVPALPVSMPLPLPLPLLCTPQQHKQNEEATYNDIICHYNALIQKQRCTPRSTPRTPKQQQQQPHSDSGSFSYSSSSNKGDGDKKNNGASITHSSQPLLLSPYFLFTPDVISSQDDYVVPHDPPALVITNTVPINMVDEEDIDTMERQLCAQLSKIPSISKVLEEAEAVAVNPGYTDQGGTTVGVRSSFINNKTTQPSVRPLRMRRRETINSRIFRTSITGVGGVGSNGTTALPLLRKSSRLPTMTKTPFCAPVVPSSINNEESLEYRSPPDVRKQQQQHVQ